MAPVDIGTLVGKIEVQNNTGSAFAALDANLTAVGSKFDALGAKTTQVQSKLSAVGTSATATGSTLSAAAAPVGTLTQRLDAVQSSGDRVRATLAGLGPASTSATLPVTALGAAVSTTSTHVSNLGTQATRTGSSVGQFFSSFQSAAPTIATIGAAMSVGITAPLYEIASSAIEVGSTFIRTMNTLQAVTGASSEDFKRLEDAAIEWGIKTVYSSAQAAEAMLVLSKAGFTTDQTIGALPSTLQLAAAGSLSLKDAATMTSVVLKTFGLTTEELAHSNDVLAKAANSSLLSLNDIKQGLKFVGPVAHEAGMSLEEVASFMALVANEGIKADMAGTGLRNAILRLEAPNKKQAELMKELGLSGAYANGTLIKMPEILDRISQSGADSSKVLELFGPRAGPMMQAAVAQGSAALRTLSTSFEESTGFAKKMADAAMKGLPGAIENMNGSIETAKIALLKVLEPALIAGADAIKTIADLITSTLIPAFQSLPPFVQDGALAITAMAAIAGPASLTLIGMVYSLELLGGAFTTAAGWAAKFGLSTAVVAEATPAIAGAGEAAIGATAAFEGLFATAPAAGVATAALATGLTTAAESSTLLGGTLTLLAGPLGWVLGTGAAVLTLTGTWGDFFSILKSGASIISTLVVGAFNRLVEVGSAALNKLNELKQKAAELAAKPPESPIGLKAAFIALGDRIHGAAQNLEYFAGTLDGMKGPADQAAKGLDKIHAAAKDRTLPAIQSADGALKFLKDSLSAIQPAGFVAGNIINGFGAAADAASPAVDRLAGAHDKAGKSATDHTASVETLRAKLSGSDLLTKANDYATVLAQIGDTSTLTTKETGEFTTTFDDVIAKFRQMGPAGAVVVTKFQDLLRALQPLPPVIKEIAVDLNALGTRVDLSMPVLQARALTSSVGELAGQSGLTEIQINNLYTGIATLPNVTGLAAGSIDDLGKSTDTASAATDKWDKNLGTIAKSMSSLADITHAADGSIVRDLDNITKGMVTAAKAGSMLAQGLSTGSWSGIVSGGIEGAVAIDQATNSPNKAASIGGGALAGATIGANPALIAMTGGWSIVIGALAGAIVGWFKSRANTDVMKEVGRDWAVTITKAMGDQIKADSENLFGGNRQAAEIFDMSKIMGAAGGLNAGNLDQFTGKLRDVFSMYQTGAFTASQAIKVLDENWQAFANAGTDADGRLSAGLKEVIQLTSQSGLKTKEIAAYMQGQGAAAISGFAAAVKGSALSTKQELTDMGIQAVASISAAVAAGMSMPDALRAASPALQQIISAYNTLGLGIDDAALRSLLFQSAILDANPALMAAISGLSGEMIALDNLGLMNVDTFAAMERTGAVMYARLQAAAAAAGGSTRDALIPMQDWLRKAADEAKLLNIPLDDNTQSLIEQSKELGIWKDKGKDATAKLTDGMQSLVDKVGELIDRLTSIPDVSFNINGKYNAPQIPSQPDVPGFATGTKGKLIDFGPRGTLVTLHNQERVQTKTEAMAADKSKVFDIAPLLAEQKLTRQEVQGLREYFRTTFGTSLARSTRDESQKASRR